MWSQGTVCHDESSDDAGAARTGQPPLNVDRNIVDGGDAHVVDATGVGLRVDDAWRPDQSPLQGALLRPHRELVIASSVWNLKLNSDTIRISLTPTRFVLHRYRVLPSYVRFFYRFHWITMIFISFFSLKPKRCKLARMMWLFFKKWFGTVMLTLSTDWVATSSVWIWPWQRTGASWTLRHQKTVKPASTDWNSWSRECKLSRKSDTTGAGSGRLHWIS